MNLRDNTTLAVICCERDKDLLARMIDSCKPVISAISAVITDDGGGCESVIQQSGIPAKIERIQFADRKLFDFGLCRNRSFENALTEWVLWLDCDDIFEAVTEATEAFAEAQGQADAMGIFYDCGPTSGNLHKMRFVRNKEFHWVNNVHEELVRKDGKPSKVWAVGGKVTHAPGDKSNHEFHLSILKESCRNAPNEYAYIGKELFNIGKRAEALQWFEATAAIHPFSIERYYALVHAGICYEEQGKTEQAIDAWHRATKERPHRREAWFLLAREHGASGDIDKCLAYCSCCNAQPDMKEPMQNMKVYQLDAYKLHAKALIEKGMKEQAQMVIEKIKEPDAETEQIRQRAQ